MSRMIGSRVGSRVVPMAIRSAAGAARRFVGTEIVSSPLEALLLGGSATAVGFVATSIIASGLGDVSSPLEAIQSITVDPLNEIIVDLNEAGIEAWDQIRRTADVLTYARKAFI